MSKIIDKLAAELDAAGLRVTFDAERNSERPCVRCGAANTPRELCQVGVYTDPNDIKVKGREVVRPLCARCQAQLGLKAFYENHR